MVNRTAGAVLGVISQIALAAGAVAQDAKDDGQSSAESKPERLKEEVIVYGTRKEGYVSNTAVNLGPLGNASLLETPLSVNVMSRHLIENLQVVSPDMLFKVNPVIQMTNPQSRFFTQGYLRGFNVVTTSRTDGVPVYNSWANPDIEDKDRVEVMTGLSGFFNGVGNVGGTINFIRKRPTDSRMADVTLGLNGGTNAYLRGDFGGRLGETGKFGYRINVHGQDGDTAMDHQSIEREFVSAAFEWDITDTLQLSLDASNSEYEMHGSEVYWSTAGVLMPPAPTPSNFYGQAFTRTRNHQDHLGAGLSWEINENFQFRAALLKQDAHLTLTAANNTFVPGSGNVGDYTVRASQWIYPVNDATGGYAYLHANFGPDRFSHRMTLGYFGDKADRTPFLTGGWTDYPVVYNYNDPTPVLALPAPVTATPYRSAASQNDNFVIADQIGIGDRWTALIGLNHATIKDWSFAADGATVTSSYDESHLTPSYALLYRFSPSWSVYASQQEGLERGGVAGLFLNGVPVVNAGEVMSPLVSDQVEVGVKFQRSKVLFTAAAFDMNKGLEYYDLTNPAAPVYRQDGVREHRGLELTLTGEVMKNLILVSGLTSLDPVIKDNTNPALVGKQPDHVARLFGTMYAEYQLPALPAVTITGGAFYTGDMYIDVLNTDKLPSYVTFDLGARYESRMGDRPVTFRLNLANITNKSHWLTGHILGAQRTLYASVSTSLF